MNTSAIHHAIKLHKHPEEMQWLYNSNAELPEGITDLLRLCASERKLKKFVEKAHLEESLFSQVLYDFIEKVLFNESNSDAKKLGLLADDDPETRKLHYQLLMKIFHPDRNTSEDAAEKASRITQIYQNLKDNNNENRIFKGDNIEVSYQRTPRSSINHRTPPSSFYTATRKAQQHISYTKNAFIAFSSLALLALVVFTLNFYQEGKAQLIITKAEKNGKTSERKDIKTEPQHIGTFNKITLATLGEDTQLQIPNGYLQQLLHNLESAYEDGDVAQITPILENNPDIRNQTGAEINAKLESLFTITNDRKMLLFDVDWKSISGRFIGKGKFLSRYIMKGEDHWSTREGKAFITVEVDSNKQLNVTHLQLKDNTIEQ